MSWKNFSVNNEVFDNEYRFSKLNSIGFTFNKKNKILYFIKKNPFGKYILKGFCFYYF